MVFLAFLLCANGVESAGLTENGRGLALPRKRRTRSCGSGRLDRIAIGSTRNAGRGGEEDLWTCCLHWRRQYCREPGASEGEGYAGS